MGEEGENGKSNLIGQQNVLMQFFQSFEIMFTLLIHMICDWSMWQIIIHIKC